MLGSRVKGQEKGKSAVLNKVAQGMISQLLNIDIIQSIPLSLTLNP
jgi:hypothetical protein